MQLEGHQINQYRFIRLLRSGGMGEVYLAYDEHLDRQVAVKVIRTDTSRYPDTQAAREAARLFLREMQAIARLDQRLYCTLLCPEYRLQQFHLSSPNDHCQR